MKEQKICTSTQTSSSHTWISINVLFISYDITQTYTKQRYLLPHISCGMNCEPPELALIHELLFYHRFLSNSLTVFPWVYPATFPSFVSLGKTSSWWRLSPSWVGISRNKRPRRNRARSPSGPRRSSRDHACRRAPQSPGPWGYQVLEPVPYSGSVRYAHIVLKIKGLSPSTTRTLPYWGNANVKTEMPSEQP